MALITPQEVNTIAFVNQLDPALILPQFIESAQTKYIVPVVTQDVLDLIDATPESYTTLVDDYIKPYLAFSVKYMFYNQLLTETQLFPTSDAQRESAIAEILEVMEIKKALLLAYLISDIFSSSAETTTKPLISGIRIGGTTTITDSIGNNKTDVTAVLNAASAGLITNTDYLIFISAITGLLQKISFTSFKELILSAGGINTLSGEKATGVDAGVAGQISITDDYGYFCVTGGPAGIAVWKKFILFQT
jgi:hypothetical protein